MNTLNRGQLILLIAVALYWLSPIDALPLLPFDDLAVAILAWMNHGKIAPALEAVIDELLQGAGNED